MSENDDTKCVGCGLTAPPTETNYTLIGSRHGWRLTRVKLPDGTRVTEWRCPKCWVAFKASMPPT